MKVIIKNKEDLEKYIEENGDYNPDTNYFSQNEDGECFVIFGCTHASEAFRFVLTGTNLVVTDDDYSKEIETQTNSENPELEGFKLK